MTIIKNPCPKCGKVNTKLVPRHERECRAIAPAGASAATVALSVTHTPLTHSVTHASVTHGARSKGAARQARYRAKDPNGYRQRHAEYMRNRRAAERAARSAG